LTPDKFDDDRSPNFSRFDYQRVAECRGGRGNGGVEEGDPQPLAARHQPGGWLLALSQELSSDPGALRCRDAHPRRQVRRESFSQANGGLGRQAGSGTRCVKVDASGTTERRVAAASSLVGCRGWRGIVECHRSMCCQIGSGCMMRPCSVWEHSSVAGYCRMHCDTKYVRMITEVSEDDTDRNNMRGRGRRGFEVSCHA
jgi:hypothetical protein